MSCLDGAATGFYVSLGRKLTAVAVKTNGTPEVGTPHELFEVRGLELFNYRSPYDVADGQRFLVSTLAAGTAASPISLVLNWTAGLKR